MTFRLWRCFSLFIDKMRGKRKVLPAAVNQFETLSLSFFFQLPVLYVQWERRDSSARWRPVTNWRFSPIHSPLSERASPPLWEGGLSLGPQLQKNLSPPSFQQQLRTPWLRLCRFSRELFNWTEPVFCTQSIQSATEIDCLPSGCLLGNAHCPALQTLFETTRTHCCSIGGVTFL